MTDSGEREMQGIQYLTLQHDVIYRFTKFTLKGMCNRYQKAQKNNQQQQQQHPILHKQNKQTKNLSLWKSAQIPQDLKKFKTELWR